MPLVIPLYFAACLCVGSGALALLAASASRTGSRELRSFLHLVSVLEALVASNFVLFSFGAAGGPGISAVMYGLIVVNKCLSGVLLMSAVMVAHSALAVPWQRVGSILAGAVSLASAFLSALPPALTYDPAVRTVTRHLPLDPLAPAGLILVLYTTFLLLAFRRRIADPTARSMVTGWLIITAVFVPGFASDLFLVPSSRIMASLPRSVVFLPLYLAALSIFVLVMCARILTRRGREEPAPGDRVRIMDQLARRHELTAREVEIAGLMTSGLGNKQIAWQLGISDRTVGNHIYSLYRKMGINSRFELMGLVNSKTA
jgi:DNA-binding CsgD family transcriptional regulator